MKDSKIPKDLRMDPVASGEWPVSMFYRDGCRTPMEWEQDVPNKGFSSAKQTWLPVGSNIAVDAQENDSHSCLSFYKQLIAFRNASDIIQRGEIWFAPDTTTILGFKRTLDEHAVKVMLNFGESVSTVLKGKVILSSAVDIIQDHDKINVTLRKYGVLVYE